MQKERRGTKRPAKKESKPLKINLRLIFFAVICVFILIVKMLPSTPLKNKIKEAATKNTDYIEMFSEIKEVFKNHAAGTKEFIFPVSGVITSEFGKRTDPITLEESEHFGIDIDSPMDTKVKAAAKGIVLRAESNNYYGKYIMIDHGNGIVSLYGHLNKMSVSTGEVIKKGDIIALSGNSGRTTGPHLHFEIRKENIPVNPLDYLKP